MKKIYLFTILFTLLSGLTSNAQVVISEVFGGGGNGGATIKHDFIQLKNTGSSAVTFSNWAVQYASAAGTAWAKTDIVGPVTLNPGQYYLIRQAAGTAGTDILNHDLSGSLAMSGASGKVILTNTTTALTGAQPTGSNIVDAVAFGIVNTANQLEGVSTGGTTTVLTSTTSARRLNNGCTDTGNNLTDFLQATVVAPASSAVTEVCSNSPIIAITSPANLATFSPETANVNVTLNVQNFIIPSGTNQIRYTINGGTPVVKNDTTPIVIPTMAGTTYVIFVELIQASAPLSPVKNATVTFTIADYIVVANLSALRADVTANGIGKYYQLSSNPIVSYARTARNQKYIQDATAGVLIDDNAATITTPMVIGDAVAGLKGQSVFFAGILQIVPTVNATVASNSNTVTVQDVTLADFQTNYANYESEMVRITDNVSFPGTNVN
uniref:lamin tail domain-containing protein n=1 Tax=Flavobacterium sp. TaxID=239 RepID=UPI00286D86D9